MPVEALLLHIDLLHSAVHASDGRWDVDLYASSTVITREDWCLYAGRSLVTEPGVLYFQQLRTSTPASKQLRDPPVACTMKKVDNIVANNVCDNIFFTKSANYKPKCIPVHGLNNLHSSVRYLSCEQRSRSGGLCPGAVCRCPCGRDVTVRQPPEARRQADTDPAAHIVLAVGISLVICGIATSLLGVYGYLLKVRL